MVTKTPKLSAQAIERIRASRQTSQETDNVVVSRALQLYESLLPPSERLLPQGPNTTTA